jgi:hypothetical protein
MDGQSMERDFVFYPDGQTAHAWTQWLADTLATYHYEIVDIYYAGDYTSEPIGEEGYAYKITPHFTATYRHTTDASKNGTLELYPDYVQIKKGSTVVDSLIVTTHNYEGQADGQIINVLGFSSAEVTVTLAKNRVEVEQEDLGNLAMTNSTTPMPTDISTTEQTGTRYTKNFAFSDTQAALGIYQHLYKIAAENHVEITSLNYVDYKTEAINDTAVWIIPHFNVTYRRSGSVAENGSFNLYPRYRQVAKTPTYTYTVDSLYKDKISGEVKKKFLTLKVKKLNSKGEVVQNWTYYNAVVISGHVAGYDLYLSSTAVTDHTYLDEEAIDPQYHYTKPVENNEQFVEEMRTHLWRYQTHFVSDAGGDIYTDSHLLFQSVQVTFKDGDFTYQTQKFEKSARVTKEEIIQDPNLIGKTKVENERNFLYGGTHRLTVENLLDGEVFYTSTAVSPLWVWQP